MYHSSSSVILHHHQSLLKWVFLTRAHWLVFVWIKWKQSIKPGSNNLSGNNNPSILHFLVEFVLICERTDPAPHIKMSAGVRLLWLWVHHYASMCDSLLWVLRGCSAQLNRDTGHSEASLAPLCERKFIGVSFHQRISAAELCECYFDASMTLGCVFFPRAQPAAEQKNRSYFFSERCFLGKSRIELDLFHPAERPRVVKYQKISTGPHSRALLALCSQPLAKPKRIVQQFWQIRLLA